MINRRDLFGASLGLAAMGQTAAAATGGDAADAHGGANQILFVQQDSVLSFPPTGDGVRVGTAVGRLSGTTTTNFQFLPVPPPEFKADDEMVLSDVDGDQILFRVQVTGRFLAAFGAANKPNAPVSGLGGPFSGIYEVTRATGKFQYLVGRKFPCKGLGMNPAKSGFLGSVYVEVYTDRFDGRPL